jgi:hypothetical protein
LPFTSRIVGHELHQKLVGLTGSSFGEPQHLVEQKEKNLRPSSSTKAEEKETKKVKKRKCLLYVMISLQVLPAEHYSKS